MTTCRGCDRSQGTRRAASSTPVDTRLQLHHTAPRDVWKCILPVSDQQQNPRQRAIGQWVLGGAGHHRATTRRTKTSSSVYDADRSRSTTEKSDLTGSHEFLIGIPSVDSLQHLFELPGLFFLGLKDAVGAIRVVPSGAPDQATPSPPGKEPGLSFMLMTSILTWR